MSQRRSTISIELALAWVTCGLATACGQPEQPASDGGAPEAPGTTYTGTTGDVDLGDDEGGSEEGDSDTEQDDGTPPDMGDTGGEPSCDGICIAAWPEDWKGPVALRKTEGQGEPGECSAAWPHPVGDALYEEIVAGAADCDCECREVSSPVCGQSATVQTWSRNNCSGVVDDSWTIGPGGNTVTNIDPPANRQWSLSPRNAAATCTARTIEQVDEIEVSAMVRLCAAEFGALESACDTGSCVAEPFTPFEPNVCIWRDGDHSCPADFTERHVYHRGMADERECSTCACAAEVAQACSPGTVTLTYPSYGGGGAWASPPETLTEGECVHANYAPGGFYFTPGTANADTCQVSSPSFASGSVRPFDPVTVCCFEGE